jgi:hypothetical protein
VADLADLRRALGRCPLEFRAAHPQRLTHGLGADQADDLGQRQIDPEPAVGVEGAESGGLINPPVDGHIRRQLVKAGLLGDDRLLLHRERFLRRGRGALGVHHRTTGHQTGHHRLDLLKVPALTLMRHADQPDPPPGIRVNVGMNRGLQAPSAHPKVLSHGGSYSLSCCDRCR